MKGWEKYKLYYILLKFIITNKQLFRSESHTTLCNIFRLEKGADYFSVTYSNFWSKSYTIMSVPSLFFRGGQKFPGGPGGGQAPTFCLKKQEKDTFFLKKVLKHTTSRRWMCGPPPSDAHACYDGSKNCLKPKTQLP